MGKLCLEKNAGGIVITACTAARQPKRKTSRSTPSQRASAQLDSYLTA